MYAKCLERKCQEIVEAKLEDGQCSFRPGQSTTNQTFTLRQTFEKSWEYAKDVFTYFVDLEMTYDRDSRDKLWRVLQEYSIDGYLLIAIKSLYCQREICVQLNDKQSKSFHVGVGLRQGCVLSPLLFIIYMNLMDNLSQTDECVMIKKCKISGLLFANYLLLLASSESGLQHALNGIAAACALLEYKSALSKLRYYIF